MPDADSQIDDLFRNNGLPGRMRARFWADLERKDRYVRVLRLAGSTLRVPPLWTDSRLLHRIGTLERLAFWNAKDWKNDTRVETRRRAFLELLRTLAGPRLEGMSDWAARRDLNRFLSRIESRLGTPDVYCRPTQAIIELTNDCNLRCPSCPQSYMDAPRLIPDERILDRARGLYPWLREIDYTSFGESLLSPLLGKALSEAPGHVAKSLSSNGLLVDERMAAILVESGLNRFQISTDSASRDLFKQLRSSDAFDQVIENAKRLVRIKKERGADLPNLEFNLTLRRQNLDEVIPLIRLAAELGFQRVNSNYLIVALPEDRSDSLFHQPDRTRSVLEEADREARERGILYDHPPAPTPDRAPPVEGVCAEPWETMFFRATGRVSVCCMSGGDFEVAPEHSWEDVWDGPGYRRFRESVNCADEEAPPICRSCAMGRTIGPGDPRYHFIEEEFREHSDLLGEGYFGREVSADGIRS